MSLSMRTRLSTLEPLLESASQAPPKKRSKLYMAAWRKARLLWPPTFEVSIGLLTCVCGLTDSACFLGLGGVYANIMTGNLLNLAFVCGFSHSGYIDSSADRVASYVIAIVSFWFGSFLGGICLHSKFSKISTVFFKARRIGFFVEWFLLLATLISALFVYVSENDEVEQNSTRYNYHHRPTIVFIAAAMGLQAAMVRVFGVLDFATNVMTLTMVGAISDSTFVGGTNIRWQRRVGSVVLFFVSAVTGAALVLPPHSGPLWAFLVIFTIYTYALRGLALGDPAPAAPAAAPKPPAATTAAAAAASASAAVSAATTAAALSAPPTGPAVTVMVAAGGGSGVK